MKRLLFLTLLSLSISVFPQTTIFKNNLFDSTQISIEITKKANYYLFVFNYNNITSKDSIYNWKINLVRSALSKVFLPPHYQDNQIEIEANRIFYEYKVHEITSVPKNIQPVAGTMGFGNSTVYLTLKDEIAQQYKKDLKGAITLYKKDSLKPNKYKQFIVYPKKRINLFKRWQLSDTFLFPNDIFTKKKLKKIGPQAQEEYLKNNMLKNYDLYSDSLRYFEGNQKNIKYLIDSLNKVNKIIEEFRTLLVNLPSQTSNKKNESILKLQNDLGVVIYNSIITLKNKSDARPNDTTIQYQLSLLQKIEQINTRSIIDSIKSNGEKIPAFADFKMLMSTLFKEQQKKIVQTNQLLNNLNLKNSRIDSTLMTIKKIIANYNSYIYKFKIDSVKVEITKSFIENILAYGTIEYRDFQNSKSITSLQKYIVLRNVTPIGISTLNAIDISNIYSDLYAIINQKRYTVPLYEVLSFYRPELETQRKDYSPADTSFTLVKNYNLQICPLKKEKASELFEFKIFSDFAGIDGTSSNGLIQTEFSKEIYLNPYKHMFWKRQTHSAYWGIASYIKPSFVLSKLEKTNKYFNLSYNNSKAYIPTISIKEFEIYNIGFDANIIMCTLPFLKSYLYIDPGVYFGRTGVSDSTIVLKDSLLTINERGVNNITLSTNFRYVTQADERYFFEIKGFFHHLRLINNDIKQIAKAENYNDKLTFWGRSLIGIDFFAGYSPNKNSNGRLFFRYRFTYSLGSKDGYNQIQLGYSHYFKK